MKRIIKYGNNVDVKRFTCENCGCVFDTDRFTKSKYVFKSHKHVNEKQQVKTTNFVYAYCPCCNKICTQDEDYYVSTL